MIPKFEQAYNKLRSKDDDDFITSDWAHWNAGIRSELLVTRVNTSNYIKVPSIVNTMYPNPELVMYALAPLLQNLIEQEHVEAIYRTAMQPAVSGGAETVAFNGSISNADLVNKAYQWLRFVTKLKINTAKIRTIVEFGGGYGALALLIRRLLPEVTYFFIDTPTVGAVAYQYLQDSLPEVVNLVNTEGGNWVKPSINILSSSHMDWIPQDADIFISQGALCEAPNAMIDKVDELHWFGAKQGMLILWTHEHLMSKLAVGRKVFVEPSIPWEGQNHVYFYTPRVRAARGVTV